VYEPRKETSSGYNLGLNSVAKASSNLNGHSKNNGQDLQRILWNFNQEILKQKDSQKNLYRVNQRKLTSKDSSHFNPKENTAQTVTNTCNVSPIEFEIPPKQDTTRSARSSRILPKGNNCKKQNPFKLKVSSRRKPAGNTISPERTLKMTNDINKDHDDLLESMKKNLAMMDEWEHKLQKRSHSENRNRKYEGPDGNQVENYFTNKLKSTLNNPNGDLEQALFFSKRKKTQHLTLSKGARAIDSQPLLQKALSEKKQQPNFQKLRNDQNIHRVNLSNRISNNGCTILETERLGARNNFTRDATFQTPIRQNTDKWTSQYTDSTIPDDGLEAKYHWTFFPKGNNIYIFYLPFQLKTNIIYTNFSASNVSVKYVNFCWTAKYIHMHI
jgi:hypothetical protein